MGQNKKRMGLGSKANAVFCAIAGIFILTSASSYYGLTKLFDSFTVLTEADLAVKDAMRVTYGDMLMLRRHEKDFINRGDSKYIDKHDAYFKETIENVQKVKSIPVSYQADLKIDSLITELQNYKNIFKKYYENTLAVGDANSGYWKEAKVIGEDIGNLTEKSAPNVFASLQGMRTIAVYYLLSGKDQFKTTLKEKFAATKTVIENIQDQGLKQNVLKGFNAYVAVFEKVFIAKGNLVDAESEMREYVHAFEKQINANVEIVKAKAQEQTQALGQTNEQIKLFVLSISMAGLVLVIFFSLFFAKAIRKIIRLSEELQKSSEATEKSGSDVGATSQKVSSSVTQQASAIQETVSTLNELTAMVNKSVESAKISTDKANTGHQIARTGKENVDHMIAAMNQINTSNSEVMQQMTNSNKEIGDIIQVINEISEKTNVINDIVFQTKLLSFNASVEAARAGKHGKGFAVVAEEVGNLAQMSGEASKEIDELLKGSIKRVEDIVNRTQTSVETLMQSATHRIENGVDVARKCGESLDEVVLNVEEVKRMMSEISGASQEQAEGINNITTAMNELDEATHSNSAVANETESYAKTLQREADSLSNVVTTLREELLGSNSIVKKVVKPNLKKAPTPVVLSRESLPEASSFSNVKGLFENKKEEKASVQNESVPTEEDPRFKEVI